MSVAAHGGNAPRVVRGGGWSDRPWLLQASYRGGLEPSWRNLAVGFRCARDLKKGSSPMDIAIPLPPGARPIRWRRIPGTKAAPSFLMMDTLVTRAHWTAVMGTDPAHFKHDPDLPVESVSWYDAILFCLALSRLAGGPPAYLPLPPEEGGDVPWTILPLGPGIRLPTEAEWEHAALCGSKTDPYGPPAEIAWSAENSDGMTHPVATKQPNRCGLYDTIGNVWEWCWDPWTEAPSGRAWLAEVAASQSGFEGLGSGSEAASGIRVIRGGSWSSAVPRFLRASVRGGNVPTDRRLDLGFRCARDLPRAEALR